MAEYKPTFTLTSQMIEHLKLIPDDHHLGKALVMLFRTKIDGHEFVCNDDDMLFIGALLKNDIEKAKRTSERQRKCRDSFVTGRDSLVTVTDTPPLSQKKETTERETSPHTPYIEKESKERNLPSLPLACERTCVSESAIRILFADFWNVYPRRVAKNDAYRAYSTILEEMTEDEAKQFESVLEASLAVQKKSYDWTKENGKYIPYPATWLNGGRWADDVPETIADNGEREKEKRNDMAREALKKLGAL